jgi:hypothetical protein
MCGPRDSHQAFTVAAAMLRHLLPGAPRLRLEITADDNGTWLHLTYPAARSWPASAAESIAGALTQIDSAAQHWGHHGDAHWHTLWALLSPPADPAPPGPLDDAVDS